MKVFEWIKGRFSVVAVKDSGDESRTIADGGLSCFKEACVIASKFSAMAKLRQSLNDGPGLEVVVQQAQSELRELSSRAADYRGDVMHLLGTFLITAGLNGQAAAVLEPIASGELPVKEAETAGFAAALLKTVCRAQVSEHYGPHHAFYSCIGCGRLRLYSSAPCECCLAKPQTEAELASQNALFFRGGNLSFMLRVGNRIAGGEKFQEIPELSAEADASMLSKKFEEFRKVVLGVQDDRSIVIRDLVACKVCGNEYTLSSEEVCKCGATFQNSQLRLLACCLDNVIRGVEYGFAPRKNTLTLELLSAALRVRFGIVCSQKIDMDGIRILAECFHAKISFVSLRGSVNAADAAVEANEGNEFQVFVVDGVDELTVVFAKCLAHELSNLRRMVLSWAV